MLIKRDNVFELYPHKVRYVQYGQEYEQWALPSKEWWTEFAQKWEHTDIIEFIEVELNEEQLARYEQIKYDIPEAFREVCIDYILGGRFPEGLAYPVTKIQLLKKTMEQNEDIDVVAESAVIAMIDVNDVAEMLTYALQRIDELEASLNG